MNSITEKFPELIRVGHLVHIKKKVTLLNEGEVCYKVFIIEKGSVRSWFNCDGNDVTFQFFFEGDIVTSFESMNRELPSLYNIETITESRLRIITKNELFQFINRNVEVKKIVDDYIM